ncbi:MULTISPECIES: hypothetical protein [unclassified Mesorhizobium]|uniref:hypothetical protein n=1 Tax=unclassified Mesorhizobium TaxID=325217 RepID=UPI0011280A84|nr:MULTISPECIES: hypothetical protein [unclassified Mesorhizobium]TPK42651.1 hypothetical protein FJ550_29795 [Mesorhizobium sp. B2-5-2]TPL26771.1 hypothetical protein FJ946_13115 [Mesorhizobium sp. B2-4-7]TPL40549.1 hypothetical protein FJ961_17415 [Mesorhizobium sp. B2-4-5]TPM76823.1 hypothetical protein FJ968_03645 [Mesorhizobium sp. B2-1-6]TPN72486.1 hypothetical protein FJ985_29300 [Mesorhizobium sp. B1-1-2]
MPNTPVRAAAEGMPNLNRRNALAVSITRRFFLRSTAAGAVSVAAVAPVAAEPEKSLLEQAIWHIRELERLAFEDGAGSVAVNIIGRDWGGPTTYSHLKLMMLEPNTRAIDNSDGMFASKGGAA